MPRRLAYARLTALLAVALLAAAPARADPCRLALALGFDVSRSIDAAAYELQLGGLIAALFDPEIRAALLAPPAPVAVAVYESSARHSISATVSSTP
jgi:hypothetical protein